MNLVWYPLMAFAAVMVTFASAMLVVGLFQIGYGIYLLWKASAESENNEEL